MTETETLFNMTKGYLKDFEIVNKKVVSFELDESAPPNLREEVEEALGWGDFSQEQKIKDLENAVLELSVLIGSGV